MRGSRVPGSPGNLRLPKAPWKWHDSPLRPYTVAGLPGHGMIHAPAAGRSIAELLVHGRFQTIDPTRLGYERVEANRPYAEEGIL